MSKEEKFFKIYESEKYASKFQYFFDRGFKIKFNFLEAEIYYEIFFYGS